MALQLNPETESHLERAAADAGVDVNAYIERLLILARNQNSPEAIQRRSEVIERWLKHMETSKSNLGRNGRPWREFIHEGHNY